MRLQVSEAELRSVLAPAGFVWELKVPRSPDGAPSPIPCLAGCLEDSVLANPFTGSLALPFHADSELVHAAVGLRRGSWNAGQARGFAFAGFMCRAHAEKAITVANGQVSTPELPASSPTCLHSCLSLSRTFTNVD